MRAAAFVCFRIALATAVLVACGSARADARLLDRAGLEQVLARQVQCCVIDGRAGRQRAAQPLAEALPYRPGMKVVPTASVVVVADTDAEALSIARAIGKSHPGKDIVAVQGGAAAWSAILQAREHGAPPQGGLRFVIPRNTCESGTPLQNLIRKMP